MTKREEIKTVHGFVVDHKDSGARYAVSPSNFNPKVHTKVRELNQNETVRGFQPKRLGKTPAPQTSTPASSSEDTKNTTK